MYTKHYIKTSNLTSKLELSLSKTIDQFALPKQKLSSSDTTAEGSVTICLSQKRCLGLLENHCRKDKTVINHTAFISQRRTYRKLGIRTEHSLSNDPHTTLATNFDNFFMIKFHSS